MTDADIIRMAREAGFEVMDDRQDGGGVVIEDQGPPGAIFRFAALVRAQAMEEAAAACAAKKSDDTDWDTGHWNQAVVQCIFAIRSAAQKERTEAA